MGSGLGLLLGEDCFSVSWLLLAGFSQANSWSAAAHLLAWFQADRDDLMIEISASAIGVVAPLKSPTVSLETGHSLAPSHNDVMCLECGLWQVNTMHQTHTWQPGDHPALKSWPATLQGEFSPYLLLFFLALRRPHALWP